MASQEKMRYLLFHRIRDTTGLVTTASTMPVDKRDNPATASSQIIESTNSDFTLEEESITVCIVHMLSAVSKACKRVFRPQDTQQQPAREGRSGGLGGVQSTGGTGQPSREQGVMSVPRSPRRSESVDFIWGVC